MHDLRWTAQKIARRLRLIEPLVYRHSSALAPFRYRELPGPHSPPPVGPQVDDGSWPAIEPHSYWGRWLADFVLRTRFRVPADWDTAAPAALYLPLGESGDFSHPEALVYVDGLPYAACDRHHQEVLLPASWRDGREHLLALHGWTGLGGWIPGTPRTKLFMHPCAVVQIDPPTRDFVALARVALGVVEALEPAQPARDRLLNALDRAFLLLDTREPLGEGFYASVVEALAVLQEEVERAGPALEVDVVATGHAHLDVAWLWTLDQTRRKAGRTFYTVQRLMEQFPDYHFTQSQPQLYAFVQEDYPELFEAIRGRVAQGRWEPIGGTWVEMDCNVTGAESLARQFLLGRRYFREQFGPGAESPVLWLPDVFGYAACLPQLIRQAGLDYFFTTKIGWNQYNRLPYDTFWWQGLDGSRVLTHFNTTPGSYRPGNYNAVVSPQEVLDTWREFQQKELEQPLTMVFGYGDGGGGPTREMLENLHLLRDFPGMPRLRPGAMGAFFRQVESTVGQDLPTWNGELYLELHRGTYTTQSRTKRANRKCEFLLHDAEFLAAWAAQTEGTFAYPHGRLEEAWKLLCCNQFHDIIPGSSIGPVYAEAERSYERVRSLAQGVLEEALQVVAGEAGGDLVLVNPTSFARNDLVFWPERLPPGRQLVRADDTPTPTQPAARGTWIDAGEMPPYSVLALRLVEGGTPLSQPTLRATPTLLENACLRVELDEAGDVVRIYDKASGREVLPAGAVANQFQAFEDRPLNWDAWDIDIFYDDRVWLSEPADAVEVVEAGPLRAALEIRRRILNSSYVQKISLSHNSPRLDFETHIDWCERHVLLKVAFPVDVLAPAATYDIQWGNVERPTHRNTSWDWARFEVTAHKWVDLSEGDYGVSLLNDCKYGHDVRDNVMRISLLRSPAEPDPEADLGRHSFAYSLLPHAGCWGRATVAAAYSLNDPLIVAGGTGGAAAPRPAFLAVDRPSVVIETVKGAEDGRGLIVRLYEGQRCRGPLALAAGFPLAGAWRTNLLEEDGEELQVKENVVLFGIRPYEIVTLRLLPGTVGHLRLKRGQRCLLKTKFAAFSSGTCSRSWRATWRPTTRPRPRISPCTSGG